MTILRRRSRFLSLALAAGLAGAGAALLAAGSQPRSVPIGWTVVQDAEEDEFPREDGWKLELNPAGANLRNDRLGLTHYYYGSFHVIEKTR
jgi:hypothetical protein